MTFKAFSLRCEKAFYKTRRKHCELLDEHENCHDTNKKKYEFFTREKWKMKKKTFFSFWNFIWRIWKRKIFEVITRGKSFFCRKRKGSFIRVEWVFAVVRGDEIGEKVKFWWEKTRLVVSFCCGELKDSTKWKKSWWWTQRLWQKTRIFENSPQKAWKWWIHLNQAFCDDSQDSTRTHDTCGEIQGKLNACGEFLVNSPHWTLAWCELFSKLAFIKHQSSRRQLV